MSMDSSCSMATACVASSTATITSHFSR
jgi:hypothetical protein